MTESQEIIRPQPPPGECPEDIERMNQFRQRRFVTKSGTTDGTQKSSSDYSKNANASLIGVESDRSTSVHGTPGPTLDEEPPYSSTQSGDEGLVTNGKKERKTVLPETAAANDCLFEERRPIRTFTGAQYEGTCEVKRIKLLKEMDVRIYEGPGGTSPQTSAVGTVNDTRKEMDKENMSDSKAGAAEYLNTCRTELFASIHGSDEIPDETAGLKRKNSLGELEVLGRESIREKSWTKTMKDLSTITPYTAAETLDEESDDEDEDKDLCDRESSESEWGTSDDNDNASDPRNEISCPIPPNWDSLSVSAHRVVTFTPSRNSIPDKLSDIKDNEPTVGKGKKVTGPEQASTDVLCAGTSFTPLSIGKVQMKSSAVVQEVPDEIDGKCREVVKLRGGKPVKLQSRSEVKSDKVHKENTSNKLIHQQSKHHQGNRQTEKLLSPPTTMMNKERIYLTFEELVQPHSEITTRGSSISPRRATCGSSTRATCPECKEGNEYTMDQTNMMGERMCSVCTTQDGEDGTPHFEKEFIWIPLSDVSLLEEDNTTSPAIMVESALKEKCLADKMEARDVPSIDLKRSNELLHPKRERAKNSIIRAKPLNKLNNRAPVIKDQLLKKPTATTPRYYNKAMSTAKASIGGSVLPSKPMKFGKTAPVMAAIKKDTVPQSKEIKVVASELHNPVASGTSGKVPVKKFQPEVGDIAVKNASAHHPPPSYRSMLASEGKSGAPLASEAPKRKRLLPKRQSLSKRFQLHKQPVEVQREGLTLPKIVHTEDRRATDWIKAYQKLKDTAAIETATSISVSPEQKAESYDEENLAMEQRTRSNTLNTRRGVQQNGFAPSKGSMCEALVLPDISERSLAASGATRKLPPIQKGESSYERVPPFQKRESSYKRLPPIQKRESSYGQLPPITTRRKKNNVLPYIS